MAEYRPIGKHKLEFVAQWRFWHLSWSSNIKFEILMVVGKRSLGIV